MPFPELWRECPLAVIDVETTGLDWTQERVIEIAVVHMTGDVVEDIYSTLVDPERDLPADVTAITGIQAAALVGAPRFAAVAAEVHRRLADRVLVAYNLGFDRSFVQREFGLAGVSWTPPEAQLDPLVFVRQLLKGRGPRRLGAVARELSIPLEDAHRAAADAEVAGHVLFALAKDLPPRLSELLAVQQAWARDQDNEMAARRGNRRGPRLETAAPSQEPTERGNALGPAYAWGDDTDPLRAMFRYLPDSGARR